ncbi:MAG: N-acetylmuramoyl-L-alanine amidase [Myxococcota bacterium]|nr:N-acetylmuramoyl-L-alanine amidase [Myxococcota bacterium]
MRCRWRAWSMILTVLACCAGRSGGAAGSIPAVAAPPVERFDSVVIDPGHGGDDRGARGRSGLLEKDLVLDVSRRLAKRLRGHGLEVLETRTADAFVPLETRTMLANDAGADLFISIHANSAASPKPSGSEVYFVSVDATDERSRALAERENSAFGRDAASALPTDPLVAIIGDMIASESMREANVFAKIAQAELDSIDRVASRGVKQAPFVVLLGVQMPASLIEVGFLSNPQEERALLTSERRDAIAAALERAVLQYAQRYDALRGVGRAER